MDSNAHLHGIAFTELVAFMEDLHKEESVAPIFKLKDLAHMHTIHLKQLGITTENRIHTSRLKNRLLSVNPDLKACSQGRDVILSFDADISTAIKKACAHDSDEMHLARAAQVVCKEMFAHLMDHSSRVLSKMLYHSLCLLW